MAPSPEDILADLCTNAPTTEIRDCLRTYILNSPNIDSLHKHIVSKNIRSSIESTVHYLLDRDPLGTSIKTEDYTVKGLAYQLIYRVENLLPETCMHCNEEYCINITDTPLLSCSVCGQGAHTPCVFRTLLVEEDDRASFTPEMALQKINPLMLPELKYLCKDCTEEYLPDKNDGLKKSAEKRRKQTEQTTENTPETDDVPEEDASEDTESQHNGSNDLQEGSTPARGGGGLFGANGARTHKPPASTPAAANGHTNNPPQNGAQRNGNGPTTNHPQNGNIPRPDNICPHYKRSACRYGIAGRQCPDGDHPKACKKLLTHGTRSPRGCDLGNNCDKFHPTNICSSSLKKRECYNPDCRLIHIKGTRRHKTQPEPGQNPLRHRTQPEPGQNPHTPHPQALRFQHHQNQWYDQRQQPQPQPNNNQNFHRNQNYNYEHHGGFLEDAMRSINEMKQEMQAQMQSMSPQMLIQQTLRTFREEMLKEMDNRLAPYPPLPRNNDGQTMYGEPVNAGQYQGHREEIPRGYQPMPQRNFPY